MSNEKAYNQVCWLEEQQTLYGMKRLIDGLYKVPPKECIPRAFYILKHASQETLERFLGVVEKLSKSERLRLLFCVNERYGTFYSYLVNHYDMERVEITNRLLSDCNAREWLTYLTSKKSIDSPFAEIVLYPAKLIKPGIFAFILQLNALIDAESLTPYPVSKKEFIEALIASFKSPKSFYQRFYTTQPLAVYVAWLENGLIPRAHLIYQAKAKPLVLNYFMESLPLPRRCQMLKKALTFNTPLNQFFTDNKHGLFDKSPGGYEPRLKSLYQKTLAQLNQMRREESVTDYPDGRSSIIQPTAPIMEAGPT